MRWALLFLFSFMCFVQRAVGQNTYNVAVMEYGKTKNSDSASDNVYANGKEYQKIIEEAKSDIIIFPEYGLTTPYVSKNELHSVSTVLPKDPHDMKLCRTDLNHSYEQWLIHLACAASTHHTYVVINLIERDESGGDAIYYNTNVIFNGVGELIASYRKINLCNEEDDLFDKGKDIVTFNAYGVNYGLMTGCDLLFENPAIKLIEKNVTDIIHPNSWISETPFMASLQLQDGFAKANGINFVTSTYSDPTTGRGGVDVFFANATTQGATISTAIGIKRMSARVPKIATKTPEKVCENNQQKDMPRIGGRPPGIEAFQAHTEGMELYTFQDLEIQNGESRGKVCSEKFCCVFHIKFKQELDANSEFNYKMAAFYGSKKVNFTSQTLGIRTCALVACSSKDDKSCGGRPPTVNGMFEMINISTTVPEHERVLYMPSTLGTDLKPLTNYNFCQKKEGNVTIEIVIHNAQNMITFGIFGRDYSLDVPGGKGDAPHIRHYLALILVPLISYILIQ